MDIQEIQEYLPHRYPFLLVDRVVECEPGVRLLAYKNVTYNEPFFTGHFPGLSIMPGVLIIEALAQTTGLLAGQTQPDVLGKGKTYYLVGLDKVRFKRPVVPGDKLMLEASYLRHKRNIWAFACKAEVEGEFVASAEIMCAAAEQERLIDPRAVIDEGAQLAADVTVGPFSIIGSGVVIEAGTTVGPHVVIRGPTRIGRDNKIFQFSSVGEDPQDKKYRGETTHLEIGDRNVIREYCTIHRGTAQDKGITRIGSDNLLMAYTHVAHDCAVGDHVIMANAASLAGHVRVGDHAILGGFSLVHQFCQIGPHSFSAMGSVISRDIPPYVMVGGRPTKPHGINSVGLERQGYSSEAIRQIRKAYKVVYMSGAKLEDAIKTLDKMAEETQELVSMAEFLKTTGRSILR